ncbi:MAG: ATPase [Hyphomicrobiales bacterium]|nr:MAG: ATPase [Hyphomicrobiales bacterium]
MDMGNTSEERKRTEGHVIKCDGEQVILAAYVDPNVEYMENYWTVGQIVSIGVGKNRVIGMAHKVDLPKTDWTQDGKNLIHIYVELVGEIQSKSDGEEVFTSGIASYPQMGCVGHRIRSADLSAVYKTQSSNLISIGNLTQDAEIPAEIDVDKLLSRHFAIVGTTGVGKSTSVTLMLRKIVESRPDIRVLLLDPHNEFSTAFPDHSITIDSSNLDLPFWLFKLDELAEVIFRGQKGLEVEYELLRDIIPQAKEIYKDEKYNANKSLVKRNTEKSAISADTPIPYRMVDLLSLIDERLGLLEGRAEKPILKALQARIQSIVQDQRFRFMFDVGGNGNGGDTLQDIITNVFRVPQNGRPICVFELSGLPSEVLNSVVSVMCRMAFDLALSSDGAIQTLVVCEEAHRYIPADSGLGFWPTRQAIARIAKEGRKYGVYLGIITQRPGELDPTILSQCNTIFAMRLGNQKDQEIIRDAVTNGAKSTISFLSSIANRECIAFGEALHTPMRLTFETMAAKDLPGAHIYEQQEAVRSGKDISVASVIRKMRNESRRPTDDGGVQDGNEHGVPQQERAAAPIPDEFMPSMAPVMATPPQPEVATPASERLNRPLSSERELASADSNPDKLASRGAKSLIDAFRSKK